MRMIIVGNSGSGKTWLANNLAKVYGCRVIHFDHLFWEPGGFDKKRPPEVVARMIDASKKGVSWIAEGVFGEMADKFMERAQSFVWLDMDWPMCRGRLLKRGSESKRHMEREESAEGLQQLIEWASRYYERKNGQSYEGHQKLMKYFQGEKIYLDSEADTIRLVKKASNSFESEARKLASLKLGDSF